MQLPIRIPLVAMILALAGAPSAQVQLRGAESWLERAKQNKIAGPDEFEFRYGDQLVRITYRGEIWIGGGSPQSQIALPAGGEIQAIRWAQLAEMVVLFLDVEGSGDGAWTEIVKIRTDQWRILWQQRAPAFIDEALKWRESLLVAGAGFVARVSWDDGSFVWLRSGLYRPPEIYLRFGQPVIRGANVEFTPLYNVKPVPANWPRKLVVRLSDGKILQGAPADRGESAGPR